MPNHQDGEEYSIDGTKARAEPNASSKANLPLKVACIGAGDIVRATHLPVLKAMREVEISWIADANEARAKEMAKVYDVPYRTLPSDLSQLPPADVYLIACPFGVRDPYYSALRDRTAALYVEKPFARSLKRHAELCSWFPDFALASGLMMRCYGPNIMVREILKQQLFGRVETIRFGFGKPGLVTQGNYYFEPRRGGAGMILEVGIHGIDAALFVARASRAEMKSVNAVYQDDLDLHTEARLQVKDEDGQEFGFEFIISSLQPTIEGIEIECEHAKLSYPLPGQGYAVIAEKPNMDVVVQPKGSGPAFTIQPRYVPVATSKFQMFHEYWSMFLNGVNTKTANWTSAIQSQLTTEAIENCYRFSSAEAVGGKH